MIDSSPIETWEGAGAFFTFAASGAPLWFWISVILCIVPIIVSYRAEERAEKEYGGK